MNSLKRGDKGPEVLELQKLLGIVNPDEKFGLGTEAKVKEFQAKNGLTADGVVGPKTWEKLKAPKGIEIPAGVLIGFKGDLFWIHKQEGHAGIPYWPGGASGITIDPGFDLGQMTPEKFVSLYRNILPKEQLNRLLNVIGLKGDRAKNALANNPMKDIKITREQADKVFPYAADPFWKQISDRFPNLKKDCPYAVHTAMLSIAYNRGAMNPGLEICKNFIEAKEWRGLANALMTMQQDHQLEGIRKRRREEAQLIIDELKWQAKFAQ